MLALFILALSAAPNQDLTVDEQMTVRHRTVVVRALNKDQQPVKGLKKKDFKLLVNGKSIIEFNLIEQDFNIEPDLEAPTAAGDTPQPKAEMRTTALFVDATFMRYKMFQSTIQGLNQIIDNLGANQLVRIYYGDRALTALTPFTRDKSVLKEAVAKMEYKPYFQERLYDIEAEMRAANRDYWEGERGNDPLKMKVAGETIRHNSRLRRNLFEGQFDTQAGYLKAVRDDLKRHLGARSIFMFTGGGVTNAAYLSTFNKAAKAINQAEIQVNIISFNRPPLRGMVNTEVPGAFNSVSEMHSNAHAYAKETGGVIAQVARSKNLKKAVSQVMTAASHQYQVSFQFPDDIKTIKLKYSGGKKGLTIKYGKHPGDSLRLEEEDEDVDTFATHLVYAAPSQTLAVDWQSRLFRDGNDRYRIAVYGSLEEDMQTDFQIGFAAFNGQDQPLDIRTSRIGQLDGPFRDLLICDQRPAKIRYAIRDVSKGMTTIHEQSLPETEAKGFQLSDVVLGQPRETGSLPLHFQQPAAANDRRALDPFLVNGNLLSSNILNNFSQAKVLTAFFFLEHIEAPLNSYGLSSRAESGNRTYDLTVRPVIVKQLDANTVQILAEVDISTLPPSEYKMVVTANGNGKSSSRSQTINLNTPEE